MVCITGSVVHSANAKTKSEDEDAEMPMAPRFAPGWQQRQCFMDYGNTPNQPGEPEAG